MKGSSTYMNSYGPQVATRPAAFRPGPPENITAIDLSQKFPKSVNYDTYRSYGTSEQAEARRAPIVLQPEFGNVGNSPTCSKVLFSSPCTIVTSSELLFKKSFHDPGNISYFGKHETGKNFGRPPRDPKS